MGASEQTLLAVGIGSQLMAKESRGRKQDAEAQGSLLDGLLSHSSESIHHARVWIDWEVHSFVRVKGTFVC